MISGSFRSSFADPLVQTVSQSLFSKIRESAANAFENILRGKNNEAQEEAWMKQYEEAAALAEKAQEQQRALTTSSHNDPGPNDPSSNDPASSDYNSSDPLDDRLNYLIDECESEQLVQKLLLLENDDYLSADDITTILNWSAESIPNASAISNVQSENKVLPLKDIYSLETDQNLDAQDISGNSSSRDSSGVNSSSGDSSGESSSSEDFITKDFIIKALIEAGTLLLPSTAPIKALVYAHKGVIYMKKGYQIYKVCKKAEKFLDEQPQIGIKTQVTTKLESNKQITSNTLKPDIQKPSKSIKEEVTHVEVYEIGKKEINHFKNLPEEHLPEASHVRNKIIHEDLKRRFRDGHIEREVVLSKQYKKLYEITKKDFDKYQKHLENIENVEEFHLIKIRGNPQKTGTEGHADASWLKAVEAAEDANTTQVYLNQGMRKITGDKSLPQNGRFDVTVVKKDGKIDALEVMSKTDKRTDLEERATMYMEQIPSPKKGNLKVFDIKDILNKK